MCSDRLDQGRGIGYIDDMSKPPFPPVAPGQTPPPKTMDDMSPEELWNYEAAKREKTKAQRGF